MLCNCSFQGTDICQDCSDAMNICLELREQEESQYLADERAGLKEG